MYIEKFNTGFKIQYYLILGPIYRNITRDLIFAVLNLRLLDIQGYIVYLNVCVCFANYVY